MVLPLVLSGLVAMWCERRCGRDWEAPASQRSESVFPRRRFRADAVRMPRHRASWFAASTVGTRFRWPA